MLYITGDTHGEFIRFNTENFPEQREMTRGDYVLICGDFGGMWEQQESKNEKYWLNWLEGKPFTTLFIDGNHENYDRLDAYPAEPWHGGYVQKIRPHVLHLMRGYVFELCGKSFWTFGGVSCHDVSSGILEPGDKRIREWRRDPAKFYRINHVSWWARELPSEKEMARGRQSLEEHHHRVDYIITHCPCSSVLTQMGGGKQDFLNDYLQEIKEKTEFTQWIFGHMHDERNLPHEKSVCIYEQLIRLL